ncbi:acetate--CoA ligase family protein [Nocardioides pocheonensis]|uniref:acetate--CoA ligase family protein n=1 Tax=Nocardioides pocheonensis TaxID=661485 RepID=UPI001C8318DE|nr:acetate--CoA ligase family protein [Nocardioides pocheonensis]
MQRHGDLFDALFAPRAIALVGASGDATKNTARPQRMLRSHGFGGTIVPINPGRDEIFGERAYPSILDAPGRIDHAFIMVPVDAVPRAIEECGKRGVTVATIYTDGFAETGPQGARLQEELVNVARQHGVRLLGPNCSGIYSTRPSCALSVNSAMEQLDVTPGPLAIISQSGSMTGGLVSRGLGRGVGFSRIVSIGNEADLGVGELVDLLVDDDATGAVLLFIESIRDAPRLARAARRAAEAGKPIIAYKLGRSELGRDMAASHTGAMVGADEVVDAYFRANGILRVDNLETLFELPPLLVSQRPAQQHRVAVMSTTGGGAGIVVDRLGTVGVNVVPPSPKVIENLAARGITISDARVTDLTHAGTRADVYGPVLEELLASDHCDLVLAVAGSSAQFQPEIAVEPVISADRNGKPLAMFIAPHAVESLRLLDESGVAGFRTPESCVDAIRAWACWTPPKEEQLTDDDRLAAVTRALETAEGTTLNEREASTVFEALGIPFARSEIIAEPDHEVALTFPVVAKVLSADVLHKTDAGGVQLGIADAEALRLSASAIIERVRANVPEARIEGILVQQMESGLAEVILGFRHDPQIGPIVVLGVGGVMAEVYRDFAVRLAPVDLDEARAMIEEVSGLKVLSGFRGLPPGDKEALAQVVSSMSQLGCLTGIEISEAEINPLLVREEGRGVVAVDGLFVLRSGR